VLMLRIIPLSLASYGGSQLIITAQKHVTYLKEFDTRTFPAFC
jgi:hypothetical protein